MKIRNFHMVCGLRFSVCGYLFRVFYARIVRLEGVLDG